MDLTLFELGMKHDKAAFHKTHSLDAGYGQPQGRLWLRYRLTTHVSAAIQSSNYPSYNSRFGLASGGFLCAVAGCDLSHGRNSSCLARANWMAGAGAASACDSASCEGW